MKSEINKGELIESAYLIVKKRMLNRRMAALRIQFSKSNTDTEKARLLFDMIKIVDEKQRNNIQ